MLASWELECQDASKGPGAAKGKAAPGTISNHCQFFKNFTTLTLVQKLGI